MSTPEVLEAIWPNLKSSVIVVTLLKLIIEYRRKELSNNLISIGKIINFHGINGEVKVGFSPGHEKQLEELKEFYVEVDKKLITLTKLSLRFHKHCALMKFKELNSVDEVVALKGSFLKIEKSKIRTFLEKDEFFIDDLKGLSVYDTEGKFIGKIDFIADQGSGHLLGIIDDNKKEHLVPFVKEFVPEIDMKNAKIIIKPIPGLIEQ